LWKIMDLNKIEFENWNKCKQNINEVKWVYFKEWQIWFLSIWLNVWVESKWKWEKFSRPILIVKKFNNKMFLWIPLTTKYKDNKFLYKIKNIDWKESFLILSQIRVLSNKRLYDKIWSLSKDELGWIKKIIKERLF
jgi:mRNA interferase MazF